VTRSLVSPSRHPLHFADNPRDANLACLAESVDERQTYFAYDLFAGVRAVAADGFLMAHNTEVELLAFVDAGIRSRVRAKGGASVSHHGSSRALAGK